MNDKERGVHVVTPQILTTKFMQTQQGQKDHQYGQLSKNYYL